MQQAASVSRGTVADRIALERPRSLRMQYRFVRSLFYALRLFARLIFWQIYMQRWFPGLTERTNISRWRHYARGFRRYAISMGGVMIKLGQFASTRADVLPEEIIQELDSLQDEVPAVPYKRIKPVIERELGSIEGRFRYINEHSVSSASLGQVYRAQLQNGDKVVVKVQRPGIRDLVYTDLAALMIVARIANRFRFINRRADAVGLAEEFGRVLLEEISYRSEAENAERFGRIFKDNMGVYIPAVYKDHSTDSVLTLEDVSSIKVDDFAALEAAGISRQAVARRLMDTYMRQIFEERFFHADPHPGNLFVYPLPVENPEKHVGKGTRPFYLIFIDFGMTGSLLPEITQGIINTLAAVIHRDAHKLVKSYRELGFLLPTAEDERVEEATKLVFDQVWGRSMAEMRDIDFDTMSKIGEEFNDLLYDMPFRVPQDFVYLGRTVGILTGMCTKLDPSYNPWKEMQFYMKDILNQEEVREGIGSALTRPIMQMIGNGPSGFFSAVERLLVPHNGYLREMVELLNSGRLTVQTRAVPQDRRLFERLEIQERRTTRAILFGSFLICGTLFFTNGELALAYTGYAAAAASFLSLLFTRG